MLVERSGLGHNATVTSAVPVSDLENTEIPVSSKRRAIENILKDKGAQDTSAIDREINTYLDWSADCVEDDGLLFWKRKHGDFQASKIICRFHHQVSLSNACSRLLVSLSTAGVRH